jgi:hypothetical protein
MAIFNQSDVMEFFCIKFIIKILVVKIQSPGVIVVDSRPKERQHKGNNL